MSIYDIHKRSQNPSWSFIHIDNLLSYAIKNQNSSFILYSALELRNLIERTEYSIIIGGANSKFGDEDFEKIKKKHGIQNANKKFNSLKYRYQTFTEAFTRVVKNDLRLRTYDFKKAENIKDNLSRYVHIYSMTNEELNYDSVFMQDGFNHINSAMDFLKCYFTNNGKEYYFGILDFSTLSESMNIEFQSWLNSVDCDIDKLTERLKNIVDEKR